jgi:hypothetical protein
LIKFSIAEGGAYTKTWLRDLDESDVTPTLDEAQIDLIDFLKKTVHRTINVN